MVDVFGQERGVLRQGARRQCLGVDVVHEHIGGDHELFEESRYSMPGLVEYHASDKD